MLRNSTAHYEGSLAYEQDQTIDDNPYPVGSPEALDWCDGWHDAAKEDA